MFENTSNNIRAKKRLPQRRGYRKTDLTTAKEIVQLHRTTDMPQHSIAATLGINQGTVSKVLNGKRFPELTLH